MLGRVRGRLLKPVSKMLMGCQEVFLGFRYLCGHKTKTIECKQISLVGAFKEIDMEYKELFLTISF